MAGPRLKPQPGSAGLAGFPRPGDKAYAINAVRHRWYGQGQWVDRAAGDLRRNLIRQIRIKLGEALQITFWVSGWYRCCHGRGIGMGIGRSG